MKRFLLIMAAATAALALFAAGCTPAKKTGSASVSGASADASADRQQIQAVPDPRTHYSPAAGRTFLDTLNQGKEIALSPEDLPALEVATVHLTAAAGSPGETAQEPRYRIQILASSQADMVRKAKLDAESAVTHPVFMVSEQSVYKLYIGEFKTKQEAEAALPEIKKKGYKDAWIVNK